MMLPLFLVQERIHKKPDVDDIGFSKMQIVPVTGQSYP